LLIVAKTEEAFKNLQRQFKERRVEKRYLGLVHGKVEPKEGEIKAPVKVLPNPYASSHGMPGEVPSFLKEQGIEVIIAGGMGPRAVDFFNQFGIKVVTGAAGKVSEAVDEFLKGELKGSESCH